MPLNSSLITGAQSLFGVKTKLQFGNTSVTAVFSQQNSESNTVIAEGGASIQPFELRATDYDTDRHFFLSQYFFDNYANALKNYPLINSQINITRIEVWITNRNASTEDFRSIVAFADLGETNDPNTSYNNLVNTNGDIQSTNPPSTNSGNIPTNESNNLSSFLTNTSGIRNISTVNSAIQSFSTAMREGTDYSILENARKLQPNEYVVHPQLGYISLNRRLGEADVLAVAYEYTITGSPTVHKVGELSTDGVVAPKNLIVKLLRSEILNTSLPVWDLMMKNVYSLGAFQMSQDGFRFELLYNDDATSINS